MWGLLSKDLLFIDLIEVIANGALVARWYIGEPGVSAIGMRANLNSPWGDADDNGAMIVRFSRAMGVFEGTWTTRHQGVPNDPIVYGTKGTLVVGGGRGKPTVQVEAGESATYSCERLPQGRRQISEELIHHLDTGESLHETLQVGMNLDATAIVDAGIRSADSGKLEPVNGPDWAIG